MIEAIIFFILGAIISWVISWYFYNLSNKETPDWFGADGVETLKELLAKNPDDLEWTAKQIVNLYKNKIFNLGSSDPLPFNYCPECGSNELKNSSSTDREGDNVYYFIECKKCKG